MCAGAIKLQTFKPETLTMDAHSKDFYINDEKSLGMGNDCGSIRRRSRGWHEEIFKRARELGLAAISTAFDHTSVDFLTDIGVDAIKFLHLSLHLPLIEYVAHTGLPMLVSTGMATLDEIDEACTVIGRHNFKNLVLLKCTSAYPSSETDANIMTIADMRERYDCLVGLSDHCLSTRLAAVALQLLSVHHVE